MDVVQGLKAYPDLASLPETPDVAVFAVNPETTVSGFEEFCRMGGKGAIIVSDGFAEVGRHDLEDKLARLSREYGVAYIGPNGLGAQYRAFPRQIDESRRGNDRLRCLPGPCRKRG